MKNWEDHPPRLRRPRSWLRLAAWVLGPWLLVLFLSACDENPAATLPETPSPKPPPALHALAAPLAGAYTGAYIAGEEETITEDNVSLENIEAFEQEVGKHQAIVAFSSFWGEQRFPKAATTIIGRHHSVPLIYWSPWDRPYLESKGPDKFRLDAILAGQWDGYIDAWADGAREFGGPMLVSFCNEMNGNWFPWSGIYYGGGDSAPGAAGKAGGQPRYAGPELFKRMYHHVVDRVRARGARNIQWVFHVNNFSIPQQPWNTMAAYYPGADYIDWLGLSVYGKQFPDGAWQEFDGMMRAPYDQLAAVDATKPMMLCEWGVGEFPTDSDATGSDKAAWITEGLSDMRTEYPRLRAAIYWNERWQNSGGASRGLFSNLRVNSSPTALEAYRQGIALPFWLAEPIVQ